MKNEPKNSFKEEEKVEVVSEAESFNSSVAEPEKAPSASVLTSASIEADATAARPFDETLTPWRKRKVPRAVNSRKNLILIVLFVAIVTPLFAVVSAISSVPNGLAIVEIQTGLAAGINALILDGFRRGWNNDPAHIGSLIPVANERARRDRNAALELYNDCVRINPNFASCYMNRGVNYTYLQKNDLAMADYDKAIQLNPNYSLALNNRACLNQDLGKYALALKDHDRAIATAPHIAFFYYNRAFTYRLMNRYSEALADFFKCKSLGYPNPALQEQIDNIRSLPVKQR